MIERLITSEPPEHPLLFDSIVERITPPAETFEITLLTGDALRFRHIEGRAALRQIREAAHRFADSVTPLNAPEAMRPFVSSDRATMIWCHILGTLNLDGGGTLGFLQIQHHGPLVFDDLLEQFKSALVHIAEKAEMREIDRAKKGSRSRCSGATGSRLRKTCGAATLASSKATPGTTP